MNIKAEMLVETRLIDSATGKVVKTQKKKNLITDAGLNQFASAGIATYLVDSFTAVQVGSGTNPTSINSGAVTIDSVGTALTASSGFFTARMVGSLLKWGASGSGGVEIYIASVTNSTQAVATTSQSHIAEAGVIWFVQENFLQTLLLTSAGLQTGSGDCQSSMTGAVVSHKRTFVFSPQVGSYNVNEIGYKSTNNPSLGLTGRVVLGSTDVVAPTNFYVVVLTLSLTYSPVTPTAVADVGTNIVTAGNSMIESMMISYVNTNGTNNSSVDHFEFQAMELGFLTALTQQSNTPTTFGQANTIGSGRLTDSSTSTKSNPSVGVRRHTWAGWSFSMSGQSLVGFCLGGGFNTQGCSQKFTTPVTAPTGTMLFTSITWDFTYSRALVN